MAQATILRTLILLGALSLAVAVSGQQITGFSTVYSDHFGEWIIYTDSEEMTGELRLQWPTPDRWGAWNYRIGDQSGTLRLKWPNRNDEWEVRGGGTLASARAYLQQDPREWSITGNLAPLRWRSVYGNQFEEWQLNGERFGYFGTFTAREGDFRDWTVVDELDDSVGLADKMLLILLTIYHSTPRI